MAIFTSVSELKRVLDVDPEDTQEDVKWGLFNDWAGGIIEEFCGGRDFTLKSRTLYYSGTGTQKLLLRHRPVYTVTEVRLDQVGGFYGASSDSFDSGTVLTAGDDYALVVDQEDGSSRSGVLVRVNDLWTRPSVRQAGWLTPFVGQAHGNVKVTSVAGYTVETLPAPFRAAANLLVSRLRYLFPLGMELQGEGYEERSISLSIERRDWLMGLVKPLLWGYRNWKMGG